VEDLSKLLGVVAGHQYFRSLHLVEDVLTLQEALGQFGVRQRQESVQLRFVLILLSGVTGDDDAAGADVEAEGLRVRLFGSAHQISWPALIGHVFSFDLSASRRSQRISSRSSGFSLRSRRLIARTDRSITQSSAIRIVSA